MNFNHTLLLECLARSLRKLKKHPQYKHYIHYSYAVVDGTIYAVGTNKTASPPKHYGYSERVPDPKIHSELDAYRKLRKIVPITNTKWGLINVRVNRSGEMKISKPCDVCENWLRAVGCSGVAWTTNNGWNRQKYY